MGPGGVPEAAPPVTIIIPNYNGCALLRSNLPYVCKAAQRYPGTCDIVVVDDGSTETGTEAVVQAFAGVRLLAHERNRGFSAAIRTGVDVVDSPYLVLLNSDVAPSAGFLLPLIETLQQPEVFAVGPLIRNEDGTPHRASWNRRRLHRGRLAHIGWQADELASLTQAVPTLYVSGGSMAVKRDLFLELGGFAELYAPFYYEDEDICMRAWRRGWSCLFEPRSEITHHEHGSIRSNVADSEVRVTQRRNRLFLEWSHASGVVLAFRLGPRYVRQLLGRLVQWDTVYLRGFGRALRGLPVVRKHRRAIAASAPMRSFEEVLELVNQSSHPSVSTVGAVPPPR